MIRTVLLDIDGTLLLSNEAHARAWQEAFLRHGYDVPLGGLLRLIGLGSDKLVPEAVPGLEAESGDGQAVTGLRTEIFLDRYLPGLKPAAGARELVERLIQTGVRPVVASSAGKRELRSLLAAADVDDLLQEATTSDDAAHSKPDPDIVQAALRKAGNPPADRVLMVGDTPYDIEAAGRAGIGCVAVRCGGWQDAALRGAVAVYDDPADLLRHFGEHF